MNNTENVLYPAPAQKYKVLVRCNTYNHSKYIEETLNGFAIQQTNFPFTCLVMDDASTDGEQEVLKGWMRRECDMSKSEVIDISTSEVIIVPHRTNTSCNFAFYLLKQNLYGNPKKNDHVMPWRDACDYEAICEGDDYWIDPLKLQKQVDFLDNNPEYGMCFHNVRVVAEGCNLRTDIYGHLQNKDYTVAEFLETWTIPTCSVVYRSYIAKHIPQNDKFAVGDNVLFTTCAIFGKVRCINEYMGCYRRNTGGWTNQLLDTIPLRMIEHYEGMIESFPQVNKKIFNKLIAVNTAILSYKYLVRRDHLFFNIMYKGLKEYRFVFVMAIFNLILGKIRGN